MKRTSANAILRNASRMDSREEPGRSATDVGASQAGMDRTEGTDE